MDIKTYYPLYRDITDEEIAHFQKSRTTRPRLFVRYLIKILKTLIQIGLLLFAIYMILFSLALYDQVNILGFIIGGLIIYIIKLWRAGDRIPPERRPNHSWRHREFAEANNLTYTPVDLHNLKKNQGIIFIDYFMKTRGYAYHIISDKEGLEAGKYTLTMGQGRGAEYRILTYVKVPLNYDIPHTILTMRRRYSPIASISRIPYIMSGIERIKLHNAYDQDYRLFTLHGHEQAAYNLFNSQTLSMLTELAKRGRFDIELVGSSLFIYPHKTPELNTVRAWTNINHILDGLRDSGFIHQVNRHPDRKPRKDHLFHQEIDRLEHRFIPVVFVLTAIVITILLIYLVIAFFSTYGPWAQI